MVFGISDTESANLVEGFCELLLWHDRSAIYNAGQGLVRHLLIVIYGDAFKWQREGKGEISIPSTEPGGEGGGRKGGEKEEEKKEVMNFWTADC